MTDALRTDDELLAAAHAALVPLLAEEAGPHVALVPLSRETRWDPLRLRHIHELGLEIRRVRGRFHVLVGPSGESWGWVEPDRYPRVDPEGLPTEDEVMAAVRAALGGAGRISLVRLEAVVGRAGGHVLRLTLDGRERALVEVDPATLALLSYQRLPGGAAPPRAPRGTP